MTWTYAEAKKRHETTIGANEDSKSSRLSLMAAMSAMNDRAELIALVEKLGEALTGMVDELTPCGNETEHWEESEREVVHKARAALKELT